MSEDTPAYEAGAPRGQFTPGPWQESVLPESVLFPRRIVPTDAYGNSRSDGPIADVLSGSNPDATANALLICAAPDLVDVLERVLRDPHQRTDMWLGDVCAALIKAKGLHTDEE